MLTSISPVLVGTFMESRNQIKKVEDRWSMENKIIENTPAEEAVTSSMREEALTEEAGTANMTQTLTEETGTSSMREEALTKETGSASISEETRIDHVASSANRLPLQQIGKWK